MIFLNGFDCKHQNVIINLRIHQILGLVFRNERLMLKICAMLTSVRSPPAAASPSAVALRFTALALGLGFDFFFGAAAATASFGAARRFAGFQIPATVENQENQC